MLDFGGAIRTALGAPERRPASISRTPCDRPVPDNTDLERWKGLEGVSGVGVVIYYYPWKGGSLPRGAAWRRGTRGLKG